MLILGPNCHCVCVHSGSVSGSLGALQSLSEQGGSGIASLAVCPAPGELHFPGCWQDGKPWAVCCCFPRGCWLFAGVLVRACARFQGQWELGMQGHRAVPPSTAMEHVPACVCSDPGCLAAPGLTSSAVGVGCGSPSQLHLRALSCDHALHRAGGCL